MLKFPKIGQFRQVIRHVSSKARYRGQGENGEHIFEQGPVELPTLTYIGTPKIHGTNAGIHIAQDGTITVQSRTREITPLHDNMGFAHFVQNVVGKQYWLENFATESEGGVYIFGEWCGPGINSGCGIHQIPEKIFVVFSLYYADIGFAPADVIDLQPTDRIRNVSDFGVYRMDIDFNRTDLAQNELVKLTLEVEKECPVAKTLGYSGIGEGIVWRPWNYLDHGPEYWFKVKGDEHSSSKVKTLAAVDTEKVDSAIAFAQMVCTESRLRQGLEFLKEQGLPLDRSSTGQYLRWVVSDSITEEADTLVDSGLTPKDVGGHISRVAREWLFGII